MSLINDALKRARQSQQQRPAQPAPGAKLEPVITPVRTASPMAWLAPLLLVLMLLGGSWLIWRAWKGTAPQPQQAAIAKPPAPPPSAASPASKPVATAPESIPSKVEVNTNIIVRSVNPEPSPAAEKVASTVPEPQVATPVAPPKSEIVPPPSTPVVAITPAASIPQSKPAPTTTTAPETTPAGFPDLKLQGIFYRLTRPSVLINSRTLFVGDFVSGAKVIKIDRQSVTLEWKGQTKHLYLQ